MPSNTNTAHLSSRDLCGRGCLVGNLDTQAWELSIVVTDPAVPGPLMLTVERRVPEPVNLEAGSASLPMYISESVYKSLIRDN